MEQKKTFEPFERIITKNKESDAVWNCHLFSHYENDYVILVGGLAIGLDYTDIIPFAGNEHLVGTSDMPEEEVELKEGEMVVAFNDVGKLFNSVLYAELVTFSHLCNGKIFSKCGHEWTFCIPFSKFNPNDMEETREHILCVKNGKLVKAFKEE